MHSGGSFGRFVRSCWKGRGLKSSCSLQGSWRRGPIERCVLTMHFPPFLPSRKLKAAHLLWRKMRPSASLRVSDW